MHYRARMYVQPLGSKSGLDLKHRVTSNKVFTIERGVRGFNNLLFNLYELP